MGDPRGKVKRLLKSEMSILWGAWICKINVAAVCLPGFNSPCVQVAWAAGNISHLSFVNSGSRCDITQRRPGNRIHALRTTNIQNRLHCDELILSPELKTELDRHIRCKLNNRLIHPVTHVNELSKYHGKLWIRFWRVSNTTSLINQPDAHFQVHNFILCCY